MIRATLEQPSRERLGERRPSGLVGSPQSERGEVHEQVEWSKEELSESGIQLTTSVGPTMSRRVSLSNNRAAIRNVVLQIPTSQGPTDDFPYSIEHGATA